MKLPAAFAGFVAALTLAHGEVTLAPLFQDHAVLQSDVPVPIWGTAASGEHVTVSFKGQRVGSTALTDGRWIVYLDALESSSEPAELVVVGTNTVTISDVVVGEVWLASGQSNMEWPVEKSADAGAEMAAAAYPLIRHIKVERTVADSPAATVKTAGWRSATPANVGAFSAVAYFFAREIHRKLGVPVGIVDCSYGGTPIESWMSEAALRRTAAWPAINARWQQNLSEFPERRAHYPGELEAWTRGEQIARATRTRNPAPVPRAPIGPGTPYAIAGLFNGMVAPLQPYALRGILWYQGESNWRRPEEYAELFPALIRSWRDGWGQGEMPFYFVQLANYVVTDDPTSRGWARFREAQTQALLMRATDMATAIDIGEPKNIHARNKQEVGRRLALIAKAQVYGIAGDFSGPTFERFAREGSMIRIYFSHASTGLISYDLPVQSLEIAGSDQRFYPAIGKIERGTLVVSSREVKDPVAVRYAWSNAPVANLYNGAGLPAPPFRTDHWEPAKN